MRLIGRDRPRVAGPVSVASFPSYSVHVGRGSAERRIDLPSRPVTETVVLGAAAPGCALAPLPPLGPEGHWLVAPFIDDRGEVFVITEDPSGSRQRLSNRAPALSAILRRTCNCRGGSVTSPCPHPDAAEAIRAGIARGEWSTGGPDIVTFSAPGLFALLATSHERPWAAIAAIRHSPDLTTVEGVFVHDMVEGPRVGWGSTVSVRLEECVMCETDCLHNSLAARVPPGNLFTDVFGGVDARLDRTLERQIVSAPEWPAISLAVTQMETLNGAILKVHLRLDDIDRRFQGWDAPEDAAALLIEDIDVPAYRCITCTQFDCARMRLAARVWGRVGA